jgi:hypothetical protein
VNPDVFNEGSGDPVGPDVSGQAKFGLCTAWAATQSHGGVNGHELSAGVAFLNLTEAAGGADNVAGYCADVTPGNSSEAPVDTPNGGGTATADTASGGASEVGTSTATTASAGRSELGSANH